MNSISVKNLSFCYEKHGVLQDVTFSAQEEEFVAIFGPNGGGKTTLLNLLMGFLEPTRGYIDIFGLHPKKARHLIGWVPQNFSFDHNFPISTKEVVLGGRIRHRKFRFQAADYKMVDDALDKVDMRQEKNSPFSMLSGGQQQRVLIARALVSDPKILLLDEPTSSIDQETKKTIHDLLNVLNKHMTIIMVTHDMHSIIKSADRLLCVQKSVAQIDKEKICGHFALGLYHSQDLQ